MIGGEIHARDADKNTGVSPSFGSLEMSLEGKGQVNSPQNGVAHRALTVIKKQQGNVFTTCNFLAYEYIRRGNNFVCKH